MRLAVFVFSLIFIFVQTTAFAFVPAAVVAATARGGGAVVVRQGGKAAIIQTAATIAGNALYDWCKANKSKCASKIGDIVEEIVDDDDTRGGGQCWVTNGVEETRASTPRLSCQKANHVYPYLKPLVLVSRGHDYDAETGKVARNYSCKVEYSDFFFPVNFDYSKCSKSDYDSYDHDKDARQHALQRRIADALKDKLDDDDLADVYNNHGNKIDIDINICTGDKSCTELDEEFANNVNNNDYDLTKITPENCKMEGKKIKSCPNARWGSDKDKDDDSDSDKDKKDGDTTINVKKEDEDETTINEGDKKTLVKVDVDEDEEPHKCKTSDLTKELCEFLDWVDDEAEDPEDEKAKVKDEDFDEKLKDDRIRIERGCPPNLVLSYSMMGSRSTLEFDYKPLCSFAEKINPYLKGAGLLVSFYIVTGVRRDS